MKDGNYKLDSVIPFCEKDVEHDNKLMKDHDSFSGVGVSCLEFS
jgi:hypothetical protein